MNKLQLQAAAENYFVPSNIATETARKLLKYSQKKRKFTTNHEKRDFICCVGSECRNNSKRHFEKHHRDDMLLVERRTHRNGKLVIYEVGYCKKYGCNKRYKSCKERIGGRD